MVWCLTANDAVTNLSLRASNKTDYELHETRARPGLV